MLRRTAPLVTFYDYLGNIINIYFFIVIYRMIFDYIIDARVICNFNTIILSKIIFPTTIIRIVIVYYWDNQLPSICCFIYFFI